MRQRFEALGMFVKWKDMMEKQTDRKIKELQIGNVKKYKNQFLRFGQNTGIGTHFTDEIMSWLRRKTIPYWRRLGVCCLMHD